MSKRREVTTKQIGSAHTSQGFKVWEVNLKENEHYLCHISPFRIPETPLNLSKSCQKHPPLKIKTYQRLKRTLFHWTKQDKMRQFSRKPSFEHSFEKRFPRKFTHFVLFCPLKSVLFNILCVFDTFSEPWQSTLFEFFVCFCNPRLKPIHQLSLRCSREF